MKTFTYWEIEPGTTAIPPYILLGLVSMRRALGKDFVLLTDRSIRDYVSVELIDRDWRFSHQSGHLSPALMSIVAKSDFLRMQVVSQHGGAWIDADTIVMRDYRPRLNELLGEKLLWHSEQFFCSRPGNRFLLEAANAMGSADRLIWGDPGGIKAAVQKNKADIDFVSVDFYDPGFYPPYGARSYDVMFRNDLKAEDFLKNGHQCIQKMYNSAFVKFIPRDMSVKAFLASDLLLAKIFLMMKADSTNWVSDSIDIQDELLQEF